jgi:four helix bundle protein
MDLDHERLDVYHLALDVLVLASEIIKGLPRGRSHLSDQVSRASLPLALNLAEGARKHSKPDKRRYYLTAGGSATESAALLLGPESAQHCLAYAGDGLDVEALWSIASQGLSAPARTRAAVLSAPLSVAPS